MKIEVITRLDIRCRNYHYKGTDWILAYAPECDQYVAINFKYIEQSENGALKLTQTLNGLQMHLSPDMNSLVKSLRNEVDLDELLSAGLTKAQAICYLMDIDYNSELEALLS